MEFVRENAAHIAAWLPLAAIGTALLGAVAFFWSRRARRVTLAALSLSFSLFAAIALIVMFGRRLCHRPAL